MAEYYNVVPWSNSNEWLDVCDKLHPATTLESKKEALDKLIIWKARCPYLPSGIESTLTLLEIIIKDANTPDANDAAVDQLLRLAYSTAVMRFVNHMFDAETAKGSSLYQAAINLNVPGWVVDLRHDTAHSNSLPTLQLLRDASQISSSWLYEQYWVKHKPFICDFITTDKVVVEENEYKLGALMNLCVSLSVCAHAGRKIKNLADIPDVYMQESILNDVYELFGNSIDMSHLKTTSINSLIHLITSQSKKLLHGKDSASHITKALLSDDSLIISLELLNELDRMAILKRNFLSRQYVKCFEVLLTFLHTNDLLLEFILELIKLTKTDGIDEKKCILAALWIAEILKGLKKSRDFSEKLKSVIPSDNNHNKKGLRSLYHHWFPNGHNSILVLDLEKSVPSELTNIKFVQPLISSYNPYLTYFIRNMLDLIEPPLPKTIIDNICSLTKLIAFPDMFPSKVSPKIYTTNDFKICNSPKTDTLEGDSEVLLIQTCEENTKFEELPEKCPKNGIWKILKKDRNWSVCAIGMLPCEGSTENNMDLETKDMDIN